MPTVPTYDNLRASASQAPVAPVTLPGGPGPQEIAGQQMAQTGQAVAGAGAVALRIANAMQEQVDATRVNDAVNQARRVAQDLAYHPQTGYLNLKGNDALGRPGGVDLPDEYGNKLDEQISLIAGKLGNENQRRAFAQNAQQLATQFHGQVQTHRLAEFREHTISVQDGTIALAGDDAVRNWNKPDVIAPALGAAKAAVVEKGKALGWSAAMTDAALLTTTGKVHSAVIMSALENGGADYAMGYLERHKSEMTADDILRVQGHVNREVWAGIATKAVQSASASTAPMMAPDGFDRMVHITVQTESKGDPAALSPKGAKGIMQVLDGTNKDPGFGVRPARDNSPEERARVGRDYLQAMLQRYGDPAKAWAAYNAGPGRLDQEIKDAAKRGQPGAWLSNMPPETQGYVAKNLRALGSGEGPARPSELEFVNRAVAALPAGAPAQVVALTQTRAQQQWTLMNKDLADKADNALASAQRFLASTPGATVDQVPAATLDALRRYAPGKLDDLTRYATAIGRGEVTTDLRLYNRMEAHPEELARMTDAQFESLRGHLSAADFKHFAKERADTIAGAGNNSAEAINSPAMKAALTSRLESLGIPAVPKYNDTAAQERLGGIKQFVRNSLFDAQRAAGRKLTAEETEAHIDRLFAASVEFRDAIWGSKSTENLMALQLSDLPGDAVEGTRQALIKSGNKNPTNNDILNLYRKVHTRGAN